MMFEIRLPRPAAAARRRRHACACPAPRAFPTACCCWRRSAKARPRARPAGLRRHARHARRAARAGLRVGAEATRSSSTAWAASCARRQAKLFLGNAGTAMRPLTAAWPCWAATSSCVACRACTSGPSATWSTRCGGWAARSNTWQGGYPPLRIRSSAPCSWTRRCACAATSPASSSPRCCWRCRWWPTERHPSRSIGELISKPYIEITLNLLARFGVDVQREGWQPSPSRPAAATARRASPRRGRRSSARYFVALGAIAAGSPHPHRRRRPRLHPGRRALHRSRRGHGRRVSAGRTGWKSRGAWPLKAIELDCNHIPDAAMTLTVMALFADGPRR